MLTIIALAAIMVMCFEPSPLRMPFLRRALQTPELAGVPDRQWALYPRFLEGVRAHTRPGDTIAIVFPVMGWDAGYSYAYYRASYFLAGREVLPLADPQDHPLPQNLRDARYVAVFGATLPMPASIVWRGEGGTLLRLQ
ncbi:MAG: hypothetical protein QOC81_1236 [Thermoanaerobaculia bacterium]|nr:hypothetical protein [Thermoanaerobaculia bacterium]